MHLVRSLRVLTLALLAATAARAATYDVGLAAGQLANLRDVPWKNLQPGDTVNINAKPGGYHEIIQISSTGTAAQPILIRGIPDAVTNALPVIDGEGAVMDPNVDFRSPVFENWGVLIVTPRKTGYVYGQTFPAYLTIESLDIRNALYDPTGAPHFTDQRGVARNYDGFACGIYIEFAQHLVIRGCEISFNGNGIFANSKNGAAQASADLLIEKNYLHDNGQPIIPGISNGYHEHNIYVESVGAVYQFNRFGPLRPGCFGTMIKDRSSGTVIRYNEVVSTTCSDIFAILDPQGGAGYIDQQPDYRDAFVYGNAITLQSAGVGGTTLVTFAAFNGVSSYPTQHRGTLYFYHNTVVNHRTGTGGFFLTDPTYSGTPNIFEKVDARNNIFYTDTAIQNSVYQAFHFAVMTANTTMDFGMNWVSPGTAKNWYQHSSGTTFNGWGNLIVGDFLGQNNPNFSSLAALNYHLIGGSDALDAAGPLAPAALAKGYDLTKEYVGPQSFAPRAVIGATADLGAFESPAVYLPPPGNHAPVALPLSLNLVGLAPVAFTLPGYDADGDALTYTITGAPSRGTLTGNAPNLSFTPVAGGGTVALTYIVSDGYAISKTGYVYLSFNDAGNPPPVVSWAAPATATATYAAGSNITLSLNATDADGIAKVDFITGGAFIGTATTAPYTVTWTNVPAGTYQVVAKAFDTLNKRTVSQPLVITVQ